MSQRRPDYDAMRAREKAREVERRVPERDLSFAAHCEGYGLEWLDEPNKKDET